MNAIPLNTAAKAVDGLRFPFNCEDFAAYALNSPDDIAAGSAVWVSTVAWGCWADQRFINRGA